MTFLLAITAHCFLRPKWNVHLHLNIKKWIGLFRKIMKPLTMKFNWLLFMIHMMHNYCSPIGLFLNHCFCLLLSGPYKPDYSIQCFVPPPHLFLMADIDFANTNDIITQLVILILFDDGNLLLTVKNIPYFNVHISVLKRVSVFFNELSLQAPTRNCMAKFEITCYSIMEIDCLICAIYGLDG